MTLTLGVAFASLLLNFIAFCIAMKWLIPTNRRPIPPDPNNVPTSEEMTTDSLPIAAHVRVPAPETDLHQQSLLVQAFILQQLSLLRYFFEASVAFILHHQSLLLQCREVLEQSSDAFILHQQSLLFQEAWNSFILHQRSLLMRYREALDAFFLHRQSLLPHYREALEQSTDAFILHQQSALDALQSSVSNAPFSSLSHVVSNFQLAYESERGWKRTIRASASDLKFQWVQLDGGGGGGGGDGITEVGTSVVDLETSKNFDFLKSAFVRKIKFHEGNDWRMRTGTVELVPASEAVVDSRLVVQNQTLLSYADILQIQGRPLPEKKAWFEQICQRLTTSWEDGHIHICVRRSHLLVDSVDAILGLGREDMWKVWRIEFLGEPAIDAGGPTREWFELVTEQVFDPACGLWIPSANNQACVDINPSSGRCRNV
jgi:hypothetical protein